MCSKVSTSSEATESRHQLSTCRLQSRPVMFDTSERSKKNLPTSLLHDRHGKRGSVVSVQPFCSNVSGVIFISYEKIPSRPKTTRSKLIFHQLPHPIREVVSRLCTTARSTTKTGAHCVRQRRLPEGKFASVLRRIIFIFGSKPKETLMLLYLAILCIFKMTNN